MNATLRAAPIIAAVLNVIVPVLPVPSDYRLLTKVPAAVLALGVFLYARKPATNSRALALVIAGAVAFAVYVVLASAFLYTNPRLYVEGDNSIIGFWQTETTRQMLASGQTLPQIYESAGPRNWSTVYSLGSQAAMASVFATLYWFGFSSITWGLKR